MPSLEVDSRGVKAVANLGGFLTELLTRAESRKTTTTIEPALDKSDFGDLSGRLKELHPVVEPTQRWAPIEAVARDIFSNLVVGVGRCQSSPPDPRPTSLISY